MRKTFLIAFLPLLLVTFLSSQSLTELAKKEKERRAKLKGKKGIVVTNADLAKMRKRPAISVPVSLPPEGVGEEATGPETESQEQIPASLSEGAEKDIPPRLQELEMKWEKAKEYVDLLTLRINGLQQQFFSFEDWTLRDSIQREIVATSEKLEKAKKDLESVKSELDKERLKKRKG